MISRQNDMRITIGYLGIVILFSLFTACRNDDAGVPMPNPEAPIQFQTESAEPITNHTRSQGHTLVGSNPILSMGVYAAYTSGYWNRDADFGNNYMDNQRVERSDIHSLWTYAPEQLWPGSGRISFFSYAPHNADNTTIDAGRTGVPEIRFTVKAKQSEQVDLLVASPVLNQTKTLAATAVTIPLKHALTKIGFSARVSNPLTAGTTVKVTKIELHKLYAGGTYPMDGNVKQWDNLNSDTQVFSVAGNDGLKEHALNEVYQHLSEDDGYLFLLPQTLRSETRVKIYYEVDTNGAVDAKEFELKIADAIALFKPGEAYNFLFTIDNGISLIVAPVNWNKMQINADSNNRILNVTRVEARVTDAAVTRIYFWSNQPKEAVAVEELLIQGDPAVGTPLPVNEVYQNLSGKSDQTGTGSLMGSQYIVYRGIDENTPVGTLEKGEGYLDIVHKDGIPPTGAGYDNPQVNHIFLNASGLVRSIKLSSVDSPVNDGNANRYVGTFHRTAETGERLIRWFVPAGRSWTAEVVTDAQSGDAYGNGQYADYEDVVMDRWPSPAMEDGSLYKESVTEAEKCNVEGHPDSPQKVSGTGTVYFRIGWKKSAPNNRNRYAKVKVTIENEAEPYYLYLRQGELDDYVFRPIANDAPATGDLTTSRVHAVKWSPYNVSDPSKKTGGNSFTDHGQVDIRKGVFTAYPSQSGYFFQWANADHPRYALYPQSSTSITDWKAYTVSAFWNTLVGKHETCPSGYRRPVSGGINDNVPLVHTHSEIKQSFYHPQVAADDHAGDNIATPSLFYGYYADGYFDRREIVGAIKNNANLSRVSPNSPNAAYSGRLFVNPASLASLFFPAAGAYYNDYLDSDGNKGSYWTSSGVEALAGNAGHDALSFLFDQSTASVVASNPQSALSVRCVRDIPFEGSLPDWNTTYTPVSLEYNNELPGFDINTVIDAPYINTVIGRMQVDIGALDYSGERKYKVRARMNFIGTTNSGANQIGISAITSGFFANHFAKESSIAFAFTTEDNAKLVFGTGSSYTLIIPNGWEGVTSSGTAAPNWENAAQGDESNTITLNAKGALWIRKL